MTEYFTRISNELDSPNVVQRSMFPPTHKEWPYPDLNMANAIKGHPFEVIAYLDKYGLSISRSSAKILNEACNRVAVELDDMILLQDEDDYINEH